MALSEVEKRYGPHLREIKAFADKRETPFLILDLGKVASNYDAIARAFPSAQVFYAVKANPHPDVLRILAKKGAHFDIASVYELDTLLRLKVPAERMSYGNTIKRHEDIAYAYAKGVRLFATDSESDLKKLARHAPGARVFFRLLVDGAGADWSLSKKFGAHPDTICALAVEAKARGLVPYGLSFHVGSQQRDVEQWDQAIAQCRYLFERLEAGGIHLKMVNLGGGLPADYLVPTHGLAYYAKRINEYLATHFGAKPPVLLIEPGRAMVGSAGVLVSEVILISRKAESVPYEWLYLDAGIYNGLDETAGEAIKYPILAGCTSRTTREFVLAGPTCDSHDVLYENCRYALPSSVREGSRLYFFTAGAYTYQVSAVGFNGFPPLKVYVKK